MDENNKPIPIEAYRCPRCEEIIDGTYKEAEEHVNMPIDDPLPEGLILRNGSDFYHIISHDRTFISNYNHGHKHRQIIFSFSGQKPIFNISPDKINSKELKENLGKYYWLLTKEEFYDTKTKLSDDIAQELIRTTPELEKLIQDRPQL